MPAKTPDSPADPQNYLKRVIWKANLISVTVLLYYLFSAFLAVTDKSFPRSIKSLTGKPVSRNTSNNGI
jgi:hypothetical protein